MQGKEVGDRTGEEANNDTLIVQSSLKTKMTGTSPVAWVMEKKKHARTCRSPKLLRRRWRLSKTK